MAVSVKTSGTQTATLTTEHTLATVTDAGTYQLVVDVDNLANGETVVLKIKVKAKSGETSKLLWSMVLTHDQSASALVISPPVPAPIEFVATLTQTGGTGRDFVWAIYSY